MLHRSAPRPWLAAVVSRPLWCFVAPLLALVAAGCVPEEGVDYPRFDGGEDLGVFETFDLGMTSTELGVLRVNEFISSDELPTPLPFVDAEGDGRTFEAWTSAQASRVSFELNFHTGLGRVYAHETCLTVGCLAARPLRRHSAYGTDYWDDNYNNYLVRVSADEDGDVSVVLSHHSTNAWAVPFANGDCSIDTLYGLHFDASTSTWSASISQSVSDLFPSKEVYWFTGLASSGPTERTLLRQVESEEGLDALCEFGD